MEKVLIFGNGQIGNFYLNHYKALEVPTEIAKDVDIRNYDQVEKAIADSQPTIVINTAAQTNLEWCGENRLEAFDVNVMGAATIAKACDKLDIYMIHYSSGCIFSSVDGTDEKTEESIPNPASYYGWTKVWSEEMVMFERSANFKCLILRPRQPVSAQMSPKNMLVKMLTFSKFVDTANSGTVIEDLMVWTDELAQRRATGVYHVANTGYTTPFNIGLMIKEFILPDLEPEKIAKSELDKMTPNTRVDTVLNVDKLRNLGIEVSDYETRLREVIKQLGENIGKTDKEEVRKIMEETAIASRQRTVLNSTYESLYR